MMPNNPQMENSSNPDISESQLKRRGRRPKNVETKRSRKSSDRTMTDASYVDLPTEILVKIFNYLDSYDIRAVRLCCKHWFIAAMRPEFESKTIFKIKGGRLDNKHPAANVIYNKRIENLYLKSVQFGNVDELFEHIGSTLKTLTLQGVPIADALRLASKHFPKLQSLQVSAIRQSKTVKDIEYLPLGYLSRLKELKLEVHNSGINRCLLIFFTHAHSLDKLNLEFAKENELEVLNILDKQAKTLTRLKLQFYDTATLDVSQWREIVMKLKLKEIGIRGRCSSDFMFEILKDQTSLRSLSITGCKTLNDGDLSFIGNKFTQLERLKLFCCSGITDNGTRQLAKLSKLTSLDLTCDGLTSDGIHNIINEESNLRIKELKLQFLDLDDDIVCHCVKHLPGLRVLNLQGSENAVTDESIQAIFNSQGNLRELVVDCSVELTDLGILGILGRRKGSSIQSLKLLERLSLYKCKQLSDVSLCAIKCPHLKYLDIRYCLRMSSRGISTLVKNCPNIEEIAFTRSRIMGEKAFHILSNELSRLRTLNINNFSEEQLRLHTTNWKQTFFISCSQQATLKRYLYE